MLPRLLPCCLRLPLGTLDSGEDVNHLLNGVSHEVSIVVTRGH